MFSPRLLAVFALLATVAALPASEKPSAPQTITTITDDDVEDAPWFSIPLFGNLFSPLWQLFPTFAEIGPRIISEDDKVQIKVNVRDYKTEDLKVKLKGDFIFIQGTHEAKHDDRDLFASQFFHTYSLPANCSASDVTAERTSDGYLIITAPLNGGGDKTEDVDREVPIVENSEPSEKKGEKTTDQPAASSEDDNKEPTTPSDLDVTEKDNVIPHGNDPQL